MAFVVCAACGAESSEFNVLCHRCGTRLESSSGGDTPRRTARAGRSRQRAREWSAGEHIARYVVARKLGHGATAVVYEVVDPDTGAHGALKWLTSSSAASPRVAARMQREIRAIGALAHPHVATILEVGAHDGRPFFTMPLYEGETLEVRLARGRLAIEEAVTVLAQVADALEAIHAIGIVHRDVKPANVLLTAADGAKLVDFGLAKLPGRAASGTSLTATGAVLGTLPYMAPEQLSGERAGSAVDLWALGVIAYECLAGAKPFGRGGRLQIARDILLFDPAPVDTLPPEVPLELRRLVAELLEKDPQVRVRTSTNHRARLAAVISSRRTEDRGAT